jgi:hypothetical protein
MPASSLIDVSDLNVPGPTAEQKRFTTTLELCLAYHHESAASYAQEATEAARLETLLRSRFHADLYVPRHEIEDVLISCETKNLVLIVGLLGVGKSTLLLELQRRLEERVPSDSESSARKRAVVYLNVNERVADLGALASVSKAPICALAHNELHDKVKALGLNDRYVAYTIRHSQKYRSILTAMQNETRCTDLTDDTILTLLQTDDYKATKRALDLEYPGDAEFLCLLHFVAEHIGEPILIFDNTDGYSARLQNAVLVKCRHVLRGHCTPIVAIRTSNLRQLSRQSGESRQGQPPIEHEVTPYLALIPKTKRPDRHEMLTGLSTVKQIVTKRIDFLARNTTSNLEIDFAARLKDFVDYFFRARVSSTLLSNLLEWNNHSVRHVARDVAKMCTILIASQDPAFTSAFLDRGSSRLKTRRAETLKPLAHAAFHHYRPSFLPTRFREDPKFMTCGGALVYDSVIGALNLYASPHGNDLIPFPELYLLLLLSHAGASSVADDSGRMELGQLAPLFRNFGIKRGVLLDIVNRCTNPGLRDDMGFVRVHNRAHKLAADSPDHTEIELQPRGDYLSNDLAMTCEYLFWCALDSPHAPDYYSRIRYRKMRSDALRVSIAAKFLRSVIWRKLRQAQDRVLALEDPDVSEAYAQVFPEAGLARYMGLVVDSVRQFVVAAESEPGEVPEREASGDTEGVAVERRMSLAKAAKEDLASISEELS